MIAVFVLTAMISMATAHQGYRALIPNGYSVPDPCNPGGTWQGVGHTQSKGAGEKNDFGMAFAAENHVWTTALCNADSDQDGKTNGEELGDPHCHWTPDNHAHLSAATSHPGICEPVGSTQCKWQHFKCH